MFATYDIFDDVMLHIFFPLEAFVVSFVIVRSYKSLNSALELFLFSAIYVPFFVGYRPYLFTETLTTVEALGLATGTAISAILLHCLLVLISVRIF